MGEEISEMFSKISGNYDLMNRLLSMNIDRSWRAEAAMEAIIDKERYSVLDVAAGTCDLSIAINEMAGRSGKRVLICASDFNRKMLELGRKKIARKGITNVKTEMENAFEIAHGSNSVDVLTCAFALRSFAFSKDGGTNLGKFIRGSYRVLKPGGKIVLLEMAMPQNRSQAAIFKIYSPFMLALGSLVDYRTYAWLVRTIKAFDKGELLSLMRSTGFKKVRIRTLRSGIAFLVTAEK